MIISNVDTGSNKMNKNNRFKFLSIDDEVVSISLNDKGFNDYPMFKVEQVITKIKYLIQSYGGCDQKKLEKWFGEGVDCELLKLGAKGWQKGKLRVKLTVEFCPEQPEIEESQTNNQSESPLDDIRQMIN